MHHLFDSGFLTGLDGSEYLIHTVLWFESTASDGTVLMLFIKLFCLQLPDQS